MPLPLLWDHVRVFATYIDLHGEPCSGEVIFTAPHAVLADGVVVVPRQIVAALDGTGSIDVMLPATVDPDIAPQGWTWLVEERITPRGRGKYRLALAAGSGPVNLATAPVLPPVPAPIDPTPYIGPPGPAGPPAGPWLYLSLVNGWAGLLSNPPRVRIEGQSLRFGGVLLCSAATSAIAATLPEAYRPDIILPAMIGKNVAGAMVPTTISVMPTGAVSLLQYSGALSYLLTGVTVELRA